MKVLAIRNLWLSLFVILTCGARVSGESPDQRLRHFRAASSPIIYDGKLIVSPNLEELTPAADGTTNSQLRKLIEKRISIQRFRDRDKSAKDVGNVTYKSFAEAVWSLGVSEIDETHESEDDANVQFVEFLNQISRDLENARKLADLAWQAEFAETEAKRRIHDISSSLLVDSRPENLAIQHALKLSPSAFAMEGKIFASILVTNTSPFTMPWGAFLFSSECSYKKDHESAYLDSNTGNDRIIFEGADKAELFFVTDFEPGKTLRLVLPTAMNFARSVDRTEMIVASASGWAKMTVDVDLLKKKCVAEIKEDFKKRAKPGAEALPSSSSANYAEENFHKGSVWEGSAKLAPDRGNFGIAVNRRNTAKLFINSRNSSTGEVAGFISLNGRESVMSRFQGTVTGEKFIIDRGNGFLSGLVWEGALSGNRLTIREQTEERRSKNILQLRYRP